MVDIARAIAGKPKLLLADEPSGNLHTEQGKMIMNILKELIEEGTTIIQVTHNEAFAQYGQRIIRLLDGRVEEDVKSHLKMSI
jgi:ABC-type lipoprotein export system ATPase subunit